MEKPRGWQSRLAAAWRQILWLLLPEFGAMWSSGARRACKSTAASLWSTTWRLRIQIFSRSENAWNTTAPAMALLLRYSNKEKSWLRRLLEIADQFTAAPFKRRS